MSYNVENYHKQGGDYWVVGENVTFENKWVQKNKSIQLDVDIAEALFLDTHKAVDTLGSTEEYVK